jgi:YHYH protein
MSDGRRQNYNHDQFGGFPAATDTTFTMVEAGTVASKATCMPEGAVGMLKNGVRIFNAIDARGDDAVAHESQDQCQGHPAMTTYRYHNVPSCLRNAATGSSSVVGWMADGFPIVVERDATGALLTNADLDTSVRVC